MMYDRYMKENKLKRTQIYLSEPDYIFVKKLAENCGITVSEQIRRIMYVWIIENKK